MSVKKARKLTYTLLVAGFVLALGAYVWDPLIVIGSVVMVSALIPHFLWYRCPYCGKQLGRNDGDYCQYCGRRLDEDA